MKNLLLAASLAVAGGMQASPVPSPLFSDHAVLQRGEPIPVWGVAGAGEKIAVKFHGAVASTQANDEGKWRAVLPKMEAAQGEDLLVEGQGTFRATDVAVGDVWICSGQSNMEFAVQTSKDFDKVKAEANKPWLREIKVPHFAAQTPQQTFKAKWRMCTPAEVGTYSSVAYQFISHLYPEGDVPIGILNLSYGGTKVEEWMSPEALAAAKSGPNVLARWDADAKAYPALEAKYEVDLPAWQVRQQEALKAGKKFTEKPPAKPPGQPNHYTQPSALYFAMVTPVMGFPVKGLVWYQGESNVLHPEEYADLLAAFLGDMRAKWQAPDLPVLIVQLPNFDERKVPDQSWSQIRMAQSAVADRLPHAALAVTVDIGDPLNKHPIDKSEVGRRLALLARQNVFGEDIAAQSPRALAARRVGNVVEVEFSSSLALHGPAEAEKAFELAGADGAFHRATATLKDPKTIALVAAEVASPAQVRYLQYDNPKPTLFTNDGLPARPFALPVGP